MVCQPSLKHIARLTSKKTYKACFNLAIFINCIYLYWFPGIAARWGKWPGCFVTLSVHAVVSQIVHSYNYTLTLINHRRIPFIKLHVYVSGCCHKQQGVIRAVQTADGHFRLPCSCSGAREQARG